KKKEPIAKQLTEELLAQRHAEREEDSEVSSEVFEPSAGAAGSAAHSEATAAAGSDVPMPQQSRGVSSASGDQQHQALAALQGLPTPPSLGPAQAAASPLVVK
ncbi:unnamed protein product, partial [Prorocentrum cordatum]